MRNLERSLAENRPRALIQMATGSGKTLLAAFVSYRLIKDAGARRLLFLVDRANLGRQTLKEFQAFTVPDVNRTFTELTAGSPGGRQSVASSRTRLCRSILAHAFSGKLVPQDPSDEPASVLLERIARERSVRPAPRRRRANAKV